VTHKDLAVTPVLPEVCPNLVPDALFQSLVQPPECVSLVVSEDVLVILVRGGLLDLENGDIVLPHLDDTLGNVLCLTFKMVNNAD
jgi:hypothetical protein